MVFVMLVYEMLTNTYGKFYEWLLEMSHWLPKKCTSAGQWHFCARHFGEAFEVILTLSMYCVVTMGKTHSSVWGNMSEYHRHHKLFFKKIHPREKILRVRL